MPIFFAELMETVDAAEAWGLDGIWLGEIHFLPTRSILCSPLTVAAAIATRTRRMCIGTAVHVTPLRNPLSDRRGRRHARPPERRPVRVRHRP